MKRIQLLPFSMLLLAACCLSGCLTSRKVDRWVNKHYGEVIPSVKHSEYIKFVNEDSAMGSKPSSTIKTRNSFLPLLFYWEWHRSLQTTVNSDLSMNAFSASIISYANTKSLKEKLKGGTVELSIQGNPADFFLQYNGHLIYLLFFYISEESIYAEPQKQELTVGYKITNKGENVKTGIILVNSPNRELRQKVLQSTRKMTWNYLEQCDANIKDMSKELVDKLLVELSIN